MLEHNALFENKIQNAPIVWSQPRRDPFQDGQVVHIAKAEQSRCVYQNDPVLWGWRKLHGATLDIGRHSRGTRTVAVRDKGLLGPKIVVDELTGKYWRWAKPAIPLTVLFPLPEGPIILQNAPHRQRFFLARSERAPTVSVRPFHCRRCHRHWTLVAWALS